MDPFYLFLGLTLVMAAVLLAHQAIRAKRLDKEIGHR
jgi:hypothetical protein